MRTSETLQNTKPIKLKALRRDITVLRSSLVGLRGRTAIRKHRDLLDKIKSKEQEITFLVEDKHIEEFVEQISPLLSHAEGGEGDRVELDAVDGSTKTSGIVQQQRQAVFLNLFYRDKSAPCFVDRDVCPACSHNFVLIVQESMNICPNCGLSEHMIYCSADYIQNEEAKTAYDRRPLYRKYLMQFHEDKPDPPKEVINTVYHNLFKVHIMLASKVKPTPIGAILRQEGLQKWCSMAIRISKIINNEPVVKLSTELIDRLVTRFAGITPSDNKKTMNFEYLTNKFLIIELETEKSESFLVHTTRRVLSHADDRLTSRCKKMKFDDRQKISRSC